MVDCAEGTYRQFVWQPQKRGNARKAVKANKVNKIFITHMHADHVMGLITFLRQALGVPSAENPLPGVNRTPAIDIYGPAGLRRFVRSNLAWTYTRTAESYAVHELLRIGEDVTPCAPPEVRHASEAAGRDIFCDGDGFWREIADGGSVRGSVSVHAGPIIHRDPCIGYVFHEPAPDPAVFPARTPRKIVVLGDTSSPAALTPLVASTPGRLVLLVHEATDAYIPATIDRALAAKRTPAVVARVAAERGHSTPQHAGACAGMWGAERLVMNHIGARFSAGGDAHTAEQRQRRAQRQTKLLEMERQASELWNGTPCAVPDVPGGDGDRHAVIAFDFLTVEIPP